MNHMMKTCAVYFFVITLLLSGCGSAKNADYYVNLNVATILGDSAENEIYSDLLEDFTSQNRLVRVRDTSSMRENGYKLGLNIPSTYGKRSAPDVIYTTWSEIKDADLMAEFASLDEIRQENPEFAVNINNLALDTMAADNGGIYCFPVVAEWGGVLVNTALFGQAGAAIPQNWNQLLDAILKLRTAGIIPFANSPEDGAIVIEQMQISAGINIMLQTQIPQDADVVYDEGEDVSSGDEFVSGSEKKAVSESQIQRQIDIIKEELKIDPVIYDAYYDLCKKNVFPRAAAPIKGHEEIFAEIDIMPNPLEPERDIGQKADGIALFNEGKAAMICIDQTMAERITLKGGIELIPMPNPVIVIAPTDIMPGGCREGFFVTRRAFSSSKPRGAALSFVSYMTSNQAGARFAVLEKVPVSVDCELPENVVSGDIVLAKNLVFDAYKMMGGANGLRLSLRTPANQAFWAEVNQKCAEMSWGIY